MAAKKKSEPHFAEERRIEYFKDVVQKFMRPWIFTPGYHYSTTFEDENYNLEPGHSPKASLVNDDINFSIDLHFFKENDRKVKVRYVRRVDGVPEETLGKELLNVLDRCAENAGAILEVINHRPPSAKYFSLGIRADTSSERKIDQIAKLIRTTDDLIKLYLDK